MLKNTGILIMVSLIILCTVANSVELPPRKYATRVIAHRGASGYAPENTMAAFQKAVEMKAEIFELDVHRSLDGEIIVMHDSTTERTTGHSI